MNFDRKAVGEYDAKNVNIVHTS